MRVTTVLALLPLASAKTATATFEQAGISGTIVFTQDAEGDATDIEVNLSGLPDAALNGGEWHIHNFLPCALWGGGALGAVSACTGGHWNPFDVDNTECAEDNPAGCEVGDLSGKYGTIGDSSTFTLSVTDDYIELHGENSVVGRSLVLHEAESGDRFASAAILEDDVELEHYVASFDNTLAGTVQFFQNIDDETADTSIVIDLWNQADATATAEGYSIQFWDGRVPPFDDTCTDIGELTLSITSNTFDLPSNEADKNQWTATIPLSGDDAISGGSIVVVDADGEIVDCAGIGSQTVAEFDGSMGPTGYVSIREPSINHASIVTVALADLDEDAFPMDYHIHKFPIGPEGTADACAAEYTGGHFDPYGTESASCDGSDQPAVDCEVGDLSGKWGSIDATPYEKAIFDPNITLYDHYSVLGGRSIVLHNADGDRIACANLEPEETWYEVAGTFSGDISGTISFKQFAHSPSALTIISVDVEVADGTESTGHNFHVHEDAVADPATAETGDAGDHFNAYELNEPTENCFQTGDFADCSVGELSDKHGQLDLPATEDLKYVFADSNLPLVGEATINGRSVVIHVENEGSDYLDVANLEEVTSSDSSDDGGIPDWGWAMLIIGIVTLASIVILGVMGKLKCFGRGGDGKTSLLDSQHA